MLLCRVRFSCNKKTWSRLKHYVLGPQHSDSWSKPTNIVLFPGLNSPIQVKIPQAVLFKYLFLLVSASVLFLCLIGSLE